MIISGLIIGTELRKLTALRCFARMLYIPIAASVPKIVEHIAAISAMRSVCVIALLRPASASPENRLRYNSKEKPVQLPNILLSVNENTTMRAIGEYNTSRSNHKYSCLKLLI